MLGMTSDQPKSPGTSATVTVGGSAVVVLFILIRAEVKNLGSWQRSPPHQQLPFQTIVKYSIACEG